MSFDYATIAAPKSQDGRPKVLGLSDPLTAPTGFGRVARELFTRLAREPYDLAYLSRGWVGTRRFPGIATYSDGNRSGECQEALPMAAADFAGEDPFVLWTLLDPWQVGWLSDPDGDPRSRLASRQFLRSTRDRIRWIAHFPIDGTGPDPAAPPLRAEQYLAGADYPVAQSAFGRDLLQPLMKREVRVILHAVKTDVFCPGGRARARAEIEATYRIGFAKGLAAQLAAEPEDERMRPEEYEAEIELRRFRLEDRFTIICVMANRDRKYWWDVLRAFKLVTERIPDARLIGVCGDRRGVNPDSWPLEELCHRLDLRLEENDPDPNVTLIDTTTDRPGTPEDTALAMLYKAANIATLVSGGEGTGLPQLEAHACGIPCVVGDYSASSEQAVSNRELLSPRGYWSTAGNMVRRPLYSPKDLADRLVFAAENPRWCEETGAAGIAQAHERSWERILPQWLALLEEAIGTFATGRPVEATTAGIASTRV